MYYNIKRGEIARGCQYCLLGAKAVIFITGLCRYRCFYCPVNREKFGRDAIYVNDVPVKSVDEIVEIVAESGASGAAITGGDPLAVPDRVFLTVRALKRELGEDFHIHLYTKPSSLNRETVDVLISSGIDEVRLHLLGWSEVSVKRPAIFALKQAGISLGVEVPAVPGLEKTIAEAVNRLAAEKLIDFVNINELDVSDSNFQSLERLGFKIRENSVVGSFESAKRLMELISSVPVHICRSKSKDLFQIGARVFREAMINAGENEYVVDDGSILYTEEGVHPNSPTSRSIRVKIKLGGRYLEVS